MGALVLRVWDPITEEPCNPLGLNRVLNMGVICEEKRPSSPETGTSFVFSPRGGENRGGAGEKSGWESSGHFASITYTRYVELI